MVINNNNYTVNIKTKEITYINRKVTTKTKWQPIQVISRKSQIILKTTLFNC